MLEVELSLRPEPPAATSGAAGAPAGPRLKLSVELGTVRLSPAAEVRTSNRPVPVAPSRHVDDTQIHP